jgi:hypothetical protein
METNATPVLDDCISAMRKDEHVPFTEAYLTITLTSTGSLVPDQLRVWLPNDETVTEEIRDDRKVLELLRLFIEQEQRTTDRIGNVPF